MVLTYPAQLSFRTTHSINELCESFFMKSGWTGEYTTDIEDLASGFEDVYKLGFDNLSWEELEMTLSDANADVNASSPLNKLYINIPRCGAATDSHPEWLRHSSKD